MSADLLRQAADKLDESELTVTLLHYDDNGDALGEEEVSGVGPTLAAWLRTEAEHVEMTDDEPFGEALAVARAVLGEVS